MTVETFSDVKVVPLKIDGTMKAVGSVTVCGTIRVNFRVVQGQNGLFVGLPQRTTEKEGKKEYHPEAWFPDKQTSILLNEVVVKAYEDALKGESSAPSKSTSKIPY